MNRAEPKRPGEPMALAGPTGWVRSTTPVVPKGWEGP